MKKLVINFFGAPGSGKSTAMAYVYAGLKFAGIDCEMCLEKVKFFVYEKNQAAIKNQLHLFSEQLYELNTLYNSCQVVITDAPILSFTLYNNLKNGKKPYSDLIYAEFISFNNVNYLLKRTYNYSTFGRYQTEQEAEKVGKETRDMLDKYDIEYIETTSSKKDLDKIIADTIKFFKEI